jgi:hypothetical protein
MNSGFVCIPVSYFSFYLFEFYEDRLVSFASIVTLLCLCVVPSRSADTQYYYWAFNAEDAPYENLEYIVCFLHYTYIRSNITSH